MGVYDVTVKGHLLNLRVSSLKFIICWRNFIVSSAW